MKSNEEREDKMLCLLIGLTAIVATVILSAHYDNEAWISFWEQIG